MNWNEKEAIKDKLRNNLADFMIRHGEVISDRERSNYYCCIRMVELTWRNERFLITEVDGLTCRIEKQ
jgi:hypothetical protein